MRDLFTGKYTKLPVYRDHVPVAIEERLDDKMQPELPLDVHLRE